MIRPVSNIKVFLGFVILHLLFSQEVTFAQIKSIRSPKTRALIVGISDYQHISDLSFAHRDAEIFAHFLLEETGWKVAPEDVVLLTNEAATFGRFMTELKALKERSQTKDRLILYFSGHGDVEKVDKANRLGYLLFHDVAENAYSAGGACSVNTLDEFIRALIQEKQTTIILISDACRSGTLAGSDAGGPSATAGALAALFSNTIKIMSCAPQQVSREDEMWGNGRGLFSYYLVKGLRGMADFNEDENILVREISRFVGDSVAYASADKQTPNVIGNPIGLVSKVNPVILAQLKLNNNQLDESSNIDGLSATPKDTLYLPIYEEFIEAIANNHLLYPLDGSAYQIYERLQYQPSAEKVLGKMKKELVAAFQEKSQQAINEYTQSPGNEIAKRWANIEIYKYYPDYLEKAANLIGEEDAFYSEVKAQEHYFRGLNDRLKYDDTKDESLLQTALEEQQKALRLKPISSHIYNEIGLIYRRMGQKFQELANFQIAHNLAPKWPLALTNLALAYKRNKEYDEAEKLYQQTIQLDDSFALSYYNLAILYSQRDKDSLAINNYQKAIELKPDFYSPYNKLAYYYLRKGAYDEATSILEQYFDMNVNSSEYKAFDLLGHVYSVSGKVELAKKAFLNSIEVNSNNYLPYQHLGYLFTKEDNKSKALKYIEQAIELEPKNADSYFIMVEYFTHKEDFNKAFNYLDRVFKSGFDSKEKLMKEPFVEKLKDRERFKELISKYDLK